MVIGNGMLAKVFREYEHNNTVLLFCSGVSNSQCTEKREYEREVSLLKTAISENPDKMFIYFSTCSIGDNSLSESNYIKHKIETENYIRSNANKYLIARLSNVAGFSHNKHTVLNFFFHAISKKLRFDLWTRSYRNLIDAEHVQKIVTYIITNGLFVNSTVNIANKISVSSLSIVEKIEDYLQIKADYTLIDKGVKFDINISKIEPIAMKLNIDFAENYIELLLKKYYCSEL